MATFPSPTLQNVTVEGTATIVDTMTAANFSGTSSGTNTGDQMITLTGDVSGSGTGSFATALAAVGTAGTYGSATQIPVLTTDAKGRITDVTLAAASVGSVTSVGLADATGLFTITGSPVTSTGTLTLSAFASQGANLVLASPSGAAGAPTFRSLVSADLPSSVAYTNVANTFSTNQIFSNDSAAGTGNISFIIGHSGANDVYVFPNASSSVAYYNPLSQVNDVTIIYAVSGAGTPATGLVIGSWGGSSGIRFAPDGVPSNALGILTAYTALAPSTLTPGASPWTWQNTNAYGVFFSAWGDLGTTTALKLSKDNVTYYTISEAPNLPPIYVPPGFYVQVTFTTAPAGVTIVPV